MRTITDYYTKEYAKNSINKIGWFLYWIGACNFYLSGQVWLTHFRWWHPATWVIYLITVFLHGVMSIEEINSEMFINKIHRVNPYMGAK